METLYRRIEIKEGNSTEPVQYVGVYALNWQKEWGEPEAAFVEEEPLPPQEQFDWRRLREDFFNECTQSDHPSAPDLKRVNMAPHDLFEWFKKKACLQSQEPVTVEDIEKILQDEIMVYKGIRFPHKMSYNRLRKAAKAIHKLYGEKGKQWISVDESPKIFGGDSEDFLAYDGMSVFEAEYNGEKGWFDYESQSYTYKITHWMPLPAPPKAKNE